MGQLTIFSPGDSSYPWKLDDEVRAVGRRGLAEARAALRAGREAALRREAPAQGGPNPSRQAA